VYSKVDTFKKRQEQLCSHVFEMNPEYSQHAPTCKAKVDVNNVNEHQKRIDHNFSDCLPQPTITSPPAPPASGPNAEGINLIHANGSWLETNTKMQIKKDYTNYNNIGQKLNELRSHLDTHNFEPEVHRGCDNHS
jgi:hypothetical protein